MKRFTYLTSALIVACFVTVVNPTGTKQAGKRLLIDGNADRVKEWNYFLNVVV
ncbi:MAG: hypothetical protein WC626_04260 [Methanoregula sp.]